MIRELRPDDITAVWAIETVAHQYPWPRTIMEAQLVKKGCNFGLWQENKLAAIAMLQLIHPEAELLNIAVSPQWQGQGIGKILLTYLIDQLQHGKYQHFFLEVRASNTAAIGLYENLGFNQIGERLGYYPAPKGREDALLYAKEL